MRSRFDALTALLRTHATLWRPRPFVALPVAWEAEHPDWAAHLDTLPEERVEGSHSAWLEGAPADLRALAATTRDLAHFEPWDQADFRLEVRAARGIPGRKQRQIEAFGGAVLAWAGTPGPAALVDWCAGKAHLGRALCRKTGGALRALEIDDTLTVAGQALSDACGLRARHLTVDVLSPALEAVMLSPDALAVALHACGDLHVRLLDTVASRGLSQVALAPCCYNRMDLRAGREAAISQAGRAAAMALEPDDLDLLHQEPVVAPPAERALLRRMLTRRLAFDLWQREVTGRDVYRSVRPFPDAWLALPFASFCANVATLLADRELETAAARYPASPAFEAAGDLRRVAVARRGLVRRLFAGPLEAWLVLDRALFLAERGYEARIGTFCAREFTPRNALILARRLTQT